jgi:geranylgeranyl pyrophosphate synthase
MMSVQGASMNTFITTPFADAFSSGIPVPSSIDPHLDDALRHVLDHPGSLIRPRMAYLVATTYGMEASPAKDLAIALEYFHTASLIFDDLPCMDNALERRGGSCVHTKFGEAEAILSALALINRAYALCWRAASSTSPASQPRTLAYIEQCLGVNGLLNGQSLDLHYATLPHNHEITERIARGKTVSLIRLTLVLPAMMGGASVRELQLLERIALYWGLAYQMTDDLKDMPGSKAKSGKTVARDLLLGRPNAASAMGISDAIKRLSRFIHIGDRTLARLLQARLGLEFLRNLRSSLEDELTQITSNLGDTYMGERT